MKFLGKVLHPKDLTTKEYVDTLVQEIDDKKVDNDKITEFSEEEINNLWLNIFGSTSNTAENK